MKRFALIILIILITLIVACEQKKRTGEIESIERDEPQRIENEPPYKKNSYGLVRYGSWEEAYADGWKSDIYTEMAGEGKRYSQAWLGKPNGFVIVKLSDGNSIRCKNPFPDVGLGKKVYIKETATGDWVIEGVITEKESINRQ
jgi:hypothetical protein